MFSQYERQINIPGFGEKAQEKLKESSVLIVGAGGLGCSVATYLAVAGVGRLTICDGDVVGLSNLNRQFLYTPGDVGKPKVDCAVKALERMAPDASIAGTCEFFTADNAQCILGANSRERKMLVIDCLDNFDSRKQLIRNAVSMGLPMLHGACEQYQGQILYMDGSTSGFVCPFCYLCERQAKDLKSRPAWILGATAGVVGSMMASMAVGVLSGTRPMRNNEMYCYDGADQNLIKLSASPGCSVCGDMPRPSL